MNISAFLGAAALLLSGCAEGGLCDGGSCGPPRAPAQQAKFADFGSGLTLTATGVAGPTYTFDSPSSSSTISIKRLNGYTGAVTVGTYAYGPTSLVACSALSVGAVSSQMTFTVTAISGGSCTITLNTDSFQADSVVIDVPPTPATGS